MNAIANGTRHIPGKIIGVGSAGCSVIDGLLAIGFASDDCVMVGNCLSLCGECRCLKIDIGKRIPARGFDNDPDWCYAAAIDSVDVISAILDGSALNMIVTGMGGWIGTVAGPIIAGISQEMGALTTAVISQPFPFESKRRREKAITGIVEMKKAADITVLIPYDRLLRTLPPGTSLTGTYEIAFNTLRHAVIALLFSLINHS